MSATVQTNVARQVRDIMFEEGAPSILERHFAEDRFWGRPIITGDLQPGAYGQQFARRFAKSNRQFSVEGTNMTSALSTFHAGGGVLLTTAGASADQAILRPLLLSGDEGSQDQSSLQVTQWLTTKQVALRWIFELSSIAAVKFMAGLVGALATGATALTKGTANDQAVVHFDTADVVDAARFRCVSSNNGTDTEVVARADLVRSDSALAPAVAASTRYDLRILIDSARVPTFGLNGRIIGRGAALQNNTALFPVIGVETSEAVAKALRVRYFSISRLW